MRAENVTLLLLEMQPEIVASSRTMPSLELARRAGLLVKAAKALGIPVLASVVPLGPDHKPSLIEELRHEPPLVRTTMSAMDREAVARQITASGRGVLLLGGVSLEVALLHTALGAQRQNLAVHLLVDVCGGLSERTEQTAL